MGNVIATVLLLVVAKLVSALVGGGGSGGRYGGGSGGSRDGGGFRVEYSKNDFELVIELSEELEARLERELGATGKGLHERTSSVEAALPAVTVRALCYVASMRNTLTRDRATRGVTRALPDRAHFIWCYEAASDELRLMQHKRRLDARGKLPAAAPGCVVM